jgi:hypothetical protein
MPIFFSATEFVLSQVRSGGYLIPALRFVRKHRRIYDRF